MGSYFKKNNTWYRANDRSITRIETQNLPTQPYINIYKEVDIVSLSTDDPLNVEDIELQENINNEENEISKKNVNSRCVDCEKEVSHMCKNDCENVATFGASSTEEKNLPGNKNGEDKHNEDNVVACGDNCDNQLTHVCQFDNENECINEDFDTVLETFYQKTDQGNGVSDIIAEQIISQEQPNYNRKVVVAPTEKGKFVNYEEINDIEERCFPHLFPKGEGGYLSTYASKKVNFSNYIKMRLNGIDRRYANDQQYIIFLYQIKESLEIKRSRVTYFRKCKMNKSKYNKSSLAGLSKTEMERSDLGSKAFKNVRGTTPYFEAKKKDLFAMIRQIGPPNIFFTKSVHETSMLPLIKSLQEKDKNKIISNEEVNSMTKQQKKKLIQKYPIDVVNFLDALFRHHINSMKKSNSFGKFHIEDYFYRVEFQQRGSAHINCLFWLQTDEGQLPPKVFLEESPDEELEEYRKSEFVEYFESIVSASSSHEGIDNDAIEYQKHRHTFSCYKNKKGTIVIQKSEGFGKHTGNGDSMELQICRHNFPKYPVPETTILKEYNEIERNDVTLMKTCKKNLDIIQKFILRQTTDNLEEFEKLKFDDFLNELGINKDDYIMALRGTVNQKMMFLPKRNCNELYINNYNPKILKDDPSNQDIQIIAGEEAAFAVATYAAKYISKDEAGQSKLLKRIEEESRLFGDSTDLQLKILEKCQCRKLYFDCLDITCALHPEKKIYSNSTTRKTRRPTKAKYRRT